MKNNKIYLIVGLVILAAVAVWAAVRNQTQGMILFYGDTCPHCQIVENYITANNVQARFKFQKLEVYENKDNAALLGQYALRCHLDTKQIGVPFFFTGQTCLVGEDQIINYFKQQ